MVIAMQGKYSSVYIAALILAIFAILGSSLVSFTHLQTAERIKENQRQALLRQLHKLVPAERIDNDIALDNKQLSSFQYLGNESSLVYFGRKQGQIVAMVFEASTRSGYNGTIDTLVAVNVDGSIAGVRVTNHHETPGLGDKVEEQRSSWIHSFTDKSLSDPDINRWKVKRDGGVFDQFTGATITPRAVVETVKKTLIYYRDNRDQLLSQPQMPEEKSS